MTEKKIVKYFWDANTEQYLDARRNPVPRVKVARAAEMQIDKVEKNMLGLAIQLQNGELDLAEWRTAMVHEIKMAYISLGAVCYGGWAQMTPDKWEKVSAHLQEKFRALSDFTLQMSEAQRVDKSIVEHAKDLACLMRGAFWSKMLMPKPKPSDPLDAWFAYLHDCKCHDIKYTLADMARDAGRTYGYLRIKHADYQAEHSDEQNT